MSKTQFKYTEREEKFCRLIVEGLGQSDAYRSSWLQDRFDETSDTAPSSQEHDGQSPKITARLAELREPIRKAPQRDG